jgi:hypothetical protein
MQSVHITTELVNLNTAQGAVFDTTLCDKIIGEFGQVGGFISVLCFPPLINLTFLLFSDNL